MSQIGHATIFILSWEKTWKLKISHLKMEIPPKIFSDIKHSILWVKFWEVQFHIYGNNISFWDVKVQI